MIEKQKYSIDWFTICYNESAIIPIAIAYWNYIGARSVTVFDNGSTDGSVELLSQYPGWITVKHFDTGGKIVDKALQEIKNNCWKNSDADFCVVGDFDEFPYCYDFNKLFDFLIENDYDIVQGIGVNVMSEEFPENISRLELCLREDMRFSFSKHMNKSLLFRPNRLSETDYTIGAHFCEAKKKNGEPAKSLFGVEFEGGVFTLHYKNLGLNYLNNKCYSSASRLSEENRKHDWGGHYLFSDDLRKKLFDREMLKSFKSLDQLYRVLDSLEKIPMIFHPRENKEYWTKKDKAKN